MNIRIRTDKIKDDIITLFVFGVMLLTAIGLLLIYLTFVVVPISSFLKPLCSYSTSYYCFSFVDFISIPLPIIIFLSLLALVLTYVEISK